MRWFLLKVAYVFSLPSERFETLFFELADLISFYSEFPFDRYVVGVTRRATPFSALHLPPSHVCPGVDECWVAAWLLQAGLSDGSSGWA